MSTSKSKAKKVWVDPESLDVPTGPHNDASSIRGNVPRRLNQMVVNTYIAYGVGDGGSKKDNGNESNTSTNEIQAGGFASEVGRKVRFVATYIRHRDRSRELNRNGDRVRQNHRRSDSELSGVAVPEIGEEGRVETRAEVGADTDADADRSATPTRASPAPAPADVDVNIDVDDTHTHTSNYSKSEHNSAVAGPLEVTTIAEIVVDNSMVNGNGMLHGGCIATLIDNCASTPLVLLGLVLGRNGVGVTQGLNLLFHAPAKIGSTLQITSTSISFGGRAMSARCEIVDRDTARLVASALITKMQPAKL